MIKALLFAVALLPGAAFAVICKSVDAEGVVSYTDVPVSECKQRVKLPDYSRYAPRPIDRPGAQKSSASATQVEFVRYESAVITQPKTGDTVRDNEGRVTVGVTLQPGLQATHRISLSLDGRPIEGSFDGPAIDLNGVDRGTHTLRAYVADANGAVLISSAPVTFTMRKASLLDRQRQTTDSSGDSGQQGGDGGNNNAGQNGNAANGDTNSTSTPSYEGDFQPQFGPGENTGYKPPASQGFGSNNSFTPKYTP